jgi:enoyl-CoA hydratase/carnithine racemase
MMGPMEYTEITYEVDDRVLTITLDRPDRLNAFTYRMHEELLDAFDRVDADDDVRVVVVTGRGRGFCAGADLGEGGGTFDSSDTPAGQHRDEGGLVALRIFQCTKPVIAAVNGPAVGVGVTMTLPMDIRLASESARFGFVFARRGIVPEAASSWFLPRVVGINKATEWTFTGRVFPAEEALAGGLVRSVHPADELLPATYAIAREIVDNTSAVSVALTRQMLWRMLGEPHPMSAHRVDSRAINYMGASPDAREGVVSFLQKRPAEFTMRPTADMPDFYPWWDEPEF